MHIRQHKGQRIVRQRIVRANEKKQDFLFLNYFYFTGVKDVLLLFNHLLGSLSLSNDQ